MLLRSDDLVTWQPALALEAGAYRWRVAAFDERLAYSPYSHSVDFDLEAEEEDTSGCGCGQSASGGAWMLLLMAGLFGLRRRFV